MVGIEAQRLRYVHPGSGILTRFDIEMGRLSRVT